MLEQLFGSRTRTKLLHLFLEDYDHSFFVREICREINERIHSVRRELANLEKFGLIFSQERDQKKYYKIDTNFPIINELHLLLEKSRILFEQAITKKARKVEGLKFFALTGIFTKEEQAQTDVLLIGKISRDILEKFIKEIEKIYGRNIRYTYFTNQEFNLRKELSDKFLYSILNGKKIALVNKLTL
jgi:predicted transcriptional regulator